MDFKCPYCGQSRMQHLRSCPKIYSLIKQNQFNTKAKQEYFGKSPNVFVGSFNYPNVNIGFFSNEEIPENADNPNNWAEKNFKIPDVIDIRSNLINSKFKANVKISEINNNNKNIGKTFDQKFQEKFLEITQEISMAEKPVDVQVSLEKKPFFNISYENDITAFGPSINLKKAEITENPYIKKPVEKVVSDTDLKATEAINYLYEKGYDNYFLTKLISVGNIGLKENRKIVPTKWSITAIDDSIGKNIINEIKNYNYYDYVSHFGSYLGNYYLILFFPEPWAYELFETYIGDLNNPLPEQTMADYEFYNSRKDYAENTVGGYYAARLSILEYLKEKKRQASVIALRFISNEYYMPLGVWVVREAVKQALKSKELRFSSKELMLKYSELLLKKKFNYDKLNKSIILREMKEQKRLFEF
ncbi:MAG: hypothetical protein QXM96_01705 [Candidatus Woesearchaeota archaeon]